MAAGAGAVLTGAILNIVIALVAFLVFSLVRVWRYKESYKYYDSKRYTPAVALKATELPSTLFGWIKPVITYSEPDVIKECGLDSAIYIRLLSYGVELFLFVSAWCLVTILPVNATGGECDKLMAESEDFKFTEFDKLSLANIPAGSHRMWVHLVSVYLISFLAMRLLWRFSKDSVILRIQFLGNSRPTGSTHSVLVTDVPAVMALTNEGVKERTASMALEKKKSGELKKQQQRSGKGADLMGSEMSNNALLPGQSSETKSQDSTINEDEVHLDMAGSAERPVATTTDSTPGTARESSTQATLSLKPVDPARPLLLASGVPAAPTLRQRKTFNYDLNTTDLDPYFMAKDKLAAGATPLELVRDEFTGVYGEDVDTVQVAHDQSALDKLVAEYEKRKSDLEDYLDAVRDKSSRDEPLPPAKVTLLFPDEWMKEKYGKGTMKKVDALPFWRDRLLWLEEQINEKQEEAKKLIWPSAFITFRTRLAQAISATGLHQHDEQTWRTRPAPEPRELIWYNLGMTSSTRSSKSAVWWVIFWLMTCFFMIPIAAIQALIDVPKLATINGLKQVVNNVAVKKILEAIVPGLVLKIFIALVPMILAAMMRASGAVSESEVDFGVVSRFFIFQCVVVFAGNTIAGSFFSQATALLSDPASIFTVLGTAIPQACTFFITYIWVLLGTTPIGFIRVVGLVLMWLFMWLAGSPRARDRVYQEQYTTYGVSVVGHTMVILLGVVFSCINPIITPSALAYFAVAALVERYQNIYVFRRNYESGGQLWVKLLNQVMTALYIFQIVMIGLLAIKKFPYAVLIIPVLFPTLCFHMVVLNLFARPWSLMSLHDAAELDRNDKVVDPEALEAAVKPDPEQYVSPVFKVHKGALTQLLVEAEEADVKVKADVERREREKQEEEAAKKAGGNDKKKGLLCF